MGAGHLDFRLQRLYTLRLCASDAIADAGIDLHAFDPFIGRLRHAVNSGSDQFGGRPKFWVLASVLLHHAYCAFGNLG